MITQEAQSPVAAAADVIECREPATHAPLGTVRVTPPAEVVRIVARAKEAQRAWARTSFATRRKVLGRILDHVIDHAEELCELIVRTSGKTRDNALVGEIWPVAEKLRWTLASGERHLKPERVSSGLVMHKRATIEYRPRGVVGAIVPWNYPLQNVMNPVVAALMSGNACVVKPSEWVAFASARIQRICDEALAAEGFSTDLVRLVDGYGATGQALVEGGVDVVMFIGSVPNGRRVLETASKKLVPVVLELGGKDPMIVCDDADLEQSVHAALNGCFINCGQNCVASERLLVEDGIHDRFVARVVEEARRLRQGAPLAGAVVDVGAMTTPLQRALVDRLVARAIAEGARALTGGAATRSDGDFYPPTVLVDVRPEMEIMQEETFGPVMLVCRVKDDEHAIAVANQTRFGLGSTVMSKSARRARAIAERLDSGMVGINEFGGTTYMAQDLPFGGVKESGFGRMNGRDGLRALCHPRAILDDRLPLHFPSKLFPVGEKDFARTRGVIGLLYGRGLKRKLDGIKRLLGR